MTCWQKLDFYDFIGHSTANLKEGTLRLRETSDKLRTNSAKMNKKTWTSRRPGSMPL